MLDRFIHQNRRYEVLARFEGANRRREADRYMATHTHACVLTERDEQIIVVSDQDKGVPVQDDSEMERGWKSLT